MIHSCHHDYLVQVSIVFYIILLEEKFVFPLEHKLYNKGYINRTNFILSSNHNLVYCYAGHNISETDNYVWQSQGHMPAKFSTFR